MRFNFNNLNRNPNTYINFHGLNLFQKGGGKTKEIEVISKRDHHPRGNPTRDASLPKHHVIGPQLSPIKITCLTKEDEIPTNFIGHYPFVNNILCLSVNRTRTRVAFAIKRPRVPNCNVLACDSAKTLYRISANLCAFVSSGG